MGAREDPARLWIYLEEGGDLEALVCIMDWVMKNEPLAPSPQGFTWANFCGKLRLDEFSGGAALVHRDGPPEWQSSWGWLEQRKGQLLKDPMIEGEAA